MFEIIIFVYSQKFIIVCFPGKWSLILLQNILWGLFSIQCGIFLHIYFNTYIFYSIWILFLSFCTKMCEYICVLCMCIFKILWLNIIIIALYSEYKFKFMHIVFLSFAVYLFLHVWPSIWHKVSSAWEHLLNYFNAKLLLKFVRFYLLEQFCFKLLFKCYLSGYRILDCQLFSFSIIKICVLIYFKKLDISLIIANLKVIFFLFINL
jgi:hypothetical protein